MNWYKKAITPATTPYFEELQEGMEEELIPDQTSVQREVRDRAGVDIQSDLGCGDSGCAYMLSNGKVLKITSNSQEATNAEWLKNNPHQNISPIHHSWSEKNLYYYITDLVPNVGQAGTILSEINSQTDSQKCYNPQCALSIINGMPDFPQKQQLLSYLNHISKMPMSPFDFLSTDNSGVRGDQIIFFDIT